MAKIFLVVMVLKICLSANIQYARVKKKDKSIDYIISWKSKGLFEFKLVPLLHGAVLHNIKYFRYKIGIQFNNTPLVIEQNNYQNCKCLHCLRFK